MVQSGSAIREIELGKLARRLWKRVWLMLLCAAIAFVGTYINIEQNAEITYTATASLYISNNNPNSSNYQYTSASDLDSATRLMETYMVVIRSKKVLDVVAERLGGLYDPEAIAGCISLGSVSNTEIMAINVTTASPQLSMEICNAVADAAPTEIIRVVNAGSAEVIDYATLPLAPNDRNMLKYAVLAAMAAVLAVCGGVLLRYLFDPHVLDADDLRARYDVSILGNIPEDASRTGRLRRKDRRAAACLPAADANRFIMNDRTAPVVAEAYRALRGNLHFAARKESNKILLVSSALPGEGKSTLCCNLAMISAGREYRVLLIDGDMRRSRLAGYLGVEKGQAGLTEVLQKRKTFEEVVRREIHPGMDFLSAGTDAGVSNPSELLADVSVRPLLTRLADIYDLIIVDTPPLNVVNDTLASAGEDTSLLLVTRVGYSRHAEIAKALKTIEFAHLDLLGFVVTREKIPAGQRRHSYARYYRSYYQVPNAKGGERVSENV